MSKWVSSTQKACGAGALNDQTHMSSHSKELHRIKDGMRLSRQPKHLTKTGNAKSPNADSLDVGPYSHMFSKPKTGGLLELAGRARPLAFCKCPPGTRSVFRSVMEDLVGLTLH